MPFPSSPSNNQTAIANRIVYQYSSAKHAWSAISSVQTVNSGSVIVANVAPEFIFTAGTPVYWDPTSLNYFLIDTTALNIWVNSDTEVQYIYVNDAWIMFGKNVAGATGATGPQGPQVSTSGTTGSTGMTLTSTL
jgi:hypothetical protein